MYDPLQLLLIKAAAAVEQSEPSVVKFQFQHTRSFSRLYIAKGITGWLRLSVGVSQQEGGGKHAQDRRYKVTRMHRVPATVM